MTAIEPHTDRSAPGPPPKKLSWTRIVGPAEVERLSGISWDTFCREPRTRSCNYPNAAEALA